MSEAIDALVAAVSAACARLSDDEAVTACADGGWNAKLWLALDQIGVTAVSVPEEHGGAGGDVRTAVSVLEVLGRYSASVPLAETALLAGWMLAACGAYVPPGPLTAAVAGPDLRQRAENGGWSIAGTLPRVAWARHAEGITVLAGHQVVLLRRGDYALERGLNLAGEPRDHVTLTGNGIPGSRVYHLPVGSAVSAAAFRSRAALGRAALMAGAARRALELSVAYAGERKQFGRPLAKFQAIQHHVAAMAGEVLLSGVAAKAAASAMDTGSEAEVPVAAAKAAAGHAAGLVAARAHQVHGAIGFTQEHSLHHSTTRLWAWRDECGNEDEWAAWLGGRALDAGADRLWPLLTGPAGPPEPGRDEKSQVR
jgi:acyl-CoA dehydrogenase